jgi:hypothetical protein
VDAAAGESTLFLLPEPKNLRDDVLLMEVPEDVEEVDETPPELLMAEEGVAATASSVPMLGLGLSFLLLRMSGGSSCTGVRG